MIESYARWVVRWRLAVVLATVALVATAAAGARLLTLQADYRVYFSEDNPQLQAFDALQKTYAKNDNVLFVLAPQQGTVFTRETLAAVEELTEAAWQLPYSSRVDSLTNFQHTYAQQDDLVVEDLVTGAARLDDDALARVRAVALAEPLLRGRLVPADGAATGVNVTVQLPGLDTASKVSEVADAARALAAGVRAAHPHLRVEITGVVMMNDAFPRQAKRDVRTLVPAMFVTVVVVLGLLLRAVSGTVVQRLSCPCCLCC